MRLKKFALTLPSGDQIRHVSSLDIEAHVSTFSFVPMTKMKVWTITAAIYDAAEIWFLQKLCSKGNLIASICKLRIECFVDGPIELKEVIQSSNVRVTEFECKQLSVGEFEATIVCSLPDEDFVMNIEDFTREKVEFT